MNIRAIVIQEYISAYLDPITLNKNEVVTVSHCDLEWQGWVWVFTASGQAGWAPQQLFTFQPPNKALCRDNYTARELSVSLNEILILKKSLNGWFWAKKTSGESGWVPEACICLSELIC
ncbi:ligand-binding protein SH3 [Salmonella enterica]|nr:ligand-binding protein SH3 [Salmonella enterica]